MKILNIKETKYTYIETDEDDYYRYGPNYWMIQIGESQEPVYFCEDLEAEYQNYIKER